MLVVYEGQARGSGVAPAPEDEIEIAGTGARGKAADHQGVVALGHQPAGDRRVATLPVPPLAGNSRPLGT